MLYPQQILGNKLLLISKKVMLELGPNHSNNNLLPKICYENIMKV